MGQKGSHEWERMLRYAQNDKGSFISGFKERFYSRDDLCCLTHR